MKKASISAYQQFSEERFTRKDIYKHEDSNAFVLNFMPGQEVPAHKHPGSNLHLLVVQGKGLVTIDEKSETIEQGDVLFCEEQASFHFKNTGDEPVSLFAILNRIR